MSRRVPHDILLGRLLHKARERLEHNTKAAARGNASLAARVEVDRKLVAFLEAQLERHMAANGGVN